MLKKNYCKKIGPILLTLICSQTMSYLYKNDEKKEKVHSAIIMYRSKLNFTPIF